MEAILEAVRNTIENHILYSTTLLDAVSTGDYLLSVADVGRFQPLDRILVGSTSGTVGPEVCEISELIDATTIALSQPLTYPYSAGSQVQKLTADPDHSPRVFVGSSGIVPGDFPIIEIHPVNVDSSRMTLGGTNREFEIAVVLWLEAESSQEAYSELLKLVSQIETSLFRTYRPLLCPYWETTLEEPTEPTDATIRVTDAILCPGSSFVLEGAVSGLAPLSLWYVAGDYLGGGIYELTRPVGFSFAAGSKVLVPRRYVWDSEQYRTEYQTAERTIGATDTVLTVKSAIIRYKLQEFRASLPTTDPLTQ